MTPKTPLKSVLDSISSGFSFRTKIENDANGDLLVIQMKDLVDGYTAIGSNLTKVSSELVGRNYNLEKGDVLFIAKGSNNYSLEFNLNLHNVIASSAFFVLRPDTAAILPGYLAWYLNQTDAQRYMKQNTAGTYIPNINIGTVENMSIEIPSMEIQRKIVAIDQLGRRERLLYEEIIKKNDVVVQAALLELLKKENNHGKNQTNSGSNQHHVMGGM
jgi:restriction endonuclease S subunit